jgi:hypothetical protein
LHHYIIIKHLFKVLLFFPTKEYFFI